MRRHAQEAAARLGWSVCWVSDVWSSLEWKSFFPEARQSPSSVRGPGTRQYGVSPGTWRPRRPRGRWGRWVPHEVRLFVAPPTGPPRPRPSAALAAVERTLGFAQRWPVPSCAAVFGPFSTTRTRESTLPHRRSSRGSMAACAGRFAVPGNSETSLEFPPQGCEPKCRVW